MQVKKYILKNFDISELDRFTRVDMKFYHNGAVEETVDHLNDDEIVKWFVEDRLGETYVRRDLDSFSSDLTHLANGKTYDSKDESWKSAGHCAEASLTRIHLADNQDWFVDLYDADVCVMMVANGMGDIPERVSREVVVPNERMELFLSKLSVKV